MNLTVYHKNDTAFFTIKEYTFSHDHMGEKKINTTVYSPDSQNFEIDAYVMYRGEKYSIFKKATGKKIARTGEGIGNSMQYDLEFFAEYKVMQKANFEDYVSIDDTNQYYTGTSTFSFVNNVTELATRIQANLDRFTGEGTWTVTVDSSVVLDEKQVSASNIKIWDALLLSQSIFGLDFFISGTNITIGGSGEEIATTFYYGKNKGLYEISRIFEQNQDIITRLKTYGAGRNLPSDYLRDEYSKGRYFTQLMLPDFATTGIDYVDAPASVIDEYGIREGVMTFEDIYPSIEEVDLGEGRIDEIVSVETIDPDSDYFTITTKDLEFDINDYLTAETPRISIKGSNANLSPTYLGGYEFEIVEVTGTTVRLLKNQADGVVLPDTVTTVRAGDRFVLLGIEMPQSYITNAEDKLALRAAEYMQDEGGVELSYPVKMDEKFITENSLGDEIDSGKKAKIEDDDLDVANYFTIQTTTIKYGKSILPTYEIKLSNIKASALKAELKKTEIKQQNVNSSSSSIVNNTRVNNNVTVRGIEGDITWQ